MSKPQPPKKTGRTRPRGLQHLEKLEPHTYGSDWRKKPEYTAWRFAWHAPLFGGRLMTPAYYALRLQELYRFFVPPVLFLLAVTIGVYIWKGWPVPGVLWLLVWSIAFEAPRYLRILGQIGRALWEWPKLLGQVLAGIWLLIAFMLIWMRIR